MVTVMVYFAKEIKKSLQFAFISQLNEWEWYVCMYVWLLYLECSVGNSPISPVLSGFFWFSKIDVCEWDRTVSSALEKSPFNSVSSQPVWFIRSSHQKWQLQIFWISLWKNICACYGCHSCPVGWGCFCGWAAVQLRLQRNACDDERQLLCYICLRMSLYATDTHKKWMQKHFWHKIGLQQCSIMTAHIKYIMRCCSLQIFYQVVSFLMYVHTTHHFQSCENVFCKSCNTYNCILHSDYR